MASLFNISMEDILLNFLSENDSDSINYKMNTPHMPEITQLNKNQQLSPDEKSLLQAFDRCSKDCQQYLIAKAQVLAIKGISTDTVKEDKKYMNQGKNLILQMVLKNRNCRINKASAKQMPFRVCI